MKNLFILFYQTGNFGVRLWFCFLVAFALSIRGGAAPQAAEGGDGRGTSISVFVTIAPQVFFVEQIAGGRARVEALVPQGQSPHAYNPSPRTLVELSRAKVYFSIGLPLEQRILKGAGSSFPNLTIVNTLVGVKLRRIKPYELEGEESHDHGDSGASHEGEGIHDHDLTGWDPHVWLDPMIVKRQAESIRDGLIVADPAGREVYARRCLAFQKDLDRLYEELLGRLGPCRGRDVFVFHPAFGYFTDAFNLRQIPIEMEGKSPTPRQLVDFIRRAARVKARIIFAQPQFDKKSAAAVAKAIDGKVVPLDPLSGDYMNNLRTMAEAIESAYGEKKETP